MAATAFFKTRRQGGFTLVEMAIVLVIIGLILAAVSVGKDAQRNAEYKKISQKFVGQWAQVYNEYYERMGVPVGDNAANPTQRVGADPAFGVAADTIWGSDAAGRIAIVNEILAKGIRVPRGNGGDTAGGNENLRMEYVYLDQAGLPHTLQVGFVHSIGNNYGGLKGNLMVLQNITPELARTLDNQIDGIADGTDGIFRRWNGNDWNHDEANLQTADDSGGAEWESTNLNAAWKMTN